MERFDILVIGNGVLGLSTVIALSQAQPDLSIGIIGTPDRYGSASMASGAMLGSFGEITKYTFNSSYGAAEFELSRQAALLWPQWITELNQLLDKDSQLQTQRGTFVILNSKSGGLDTENYNAICHALTKYQEPYETVEPTDIPGLSALESSRPIRSIYIPNEDYLVSGNLLGALDHIISINPNIRVVHDTATAVRLHPRQKVVTTSMGYEFAADQVIIAAGANSQAIINSIPELAYRIPLIVCGAGCSLLVDNVNPAITSTIRTPNRAGACGLHVLPHDQKTLYIGATNNLAFTIEDHLRLSHVEFLITSAIEQINQNLRGARILKWNIGNRPISIDTFPLIGETSIPGLWLLTGNFRRGLLHSPLLAKSIAAEILGHRPLFNNCFLPERYPIQTLTREQSIQEAVKHHIAGGYEHGMELPRIFLDEVLSEMLHQKLTDFYAAMDIDFNLSPDLFFMVDGNKQNQIAFFRNYFQNLAKYYPQTKASTPQVNTTTLPA